MLSRATGSEKKWGKWVSGLVHGWKGWWNCSKTEHVVCITCISFSSLQKRPFFLSEKSPFSFVFPLVSHFPLNVLFSCQLFLFMQAATRPPIPIVLPFCSVMSPPFQTAHLFFSSCFPSHLAAQKQRLTHQLLFFYLQSSSSWLLNTTQPWGDKKKEARRKKNKKTKEMPPIWGGLQLDISRIYGRYI